MSAPSAYLLLEDGIRFDGDAVGAPGQVTGEVVFNTAMTGYQEAVSDPSYAGQIIVFTYPLIGNYGVSAAAMESEAVHARGVVMRDAKNREDAASAEGGWLDWLGDTGTPGISGLDTRALVRHIRDRGAMRGGIFPAATPEAEARELIDAEPSMAGADFARTVSPLEPVRLGGEGPHVVGMRADQFQIGLQPDAHQRDVARGRLHARADPQPRCRQVRTHARLAPWFLSRCGSGHGRGSNHATPTVSPLRCVGGGRLHSS